jgi:hypothetical protein
LSDRSFFKSTTRFFLLSQNVMDCLEIIETDHHGYYRHFIIGYPSGLDGKRVMQIGNDKHLTPGDPVPANYKFQLWERVHFKRFERYAKGSVAKVLRGGRAFIIHAVSFDFCSILKFRVRRRDLLLPWQ